MRKPSVPRPGTEEPAPQAGARGGRLPTSRLPEEHTQSLPVVRQQTTSSLDLRADRHDRVVSTGLAQRLQERRDSLRRLRRRRLLVAAAVLTVLAGLGWGVLGSPLLGLRLEQVEVTGSDGSVSVEQVREVYAGLEGRSLLRLDTGELAMATSQELVRVRDAQVSRRWPNGLRVHLSMREPVAARQVEGGFEVLDAQAVVLETAASLPAGLAWVQAPEGEELSAEMVSAVVAAVGALDPQTRSQVVSGTASVAGQVRLSLQGGANVVWGDSSQPELKAQVLRVLLGTPAQVYDVSSPRFPSTS